MTIHVGVSSRPVMAFDRTKVSAKSAFIRSRKAEVQYARQLRKIAKFIGDIVQGLYDPDDASVANVIDEALRNYSRTIEGWAETVGSRMVSEVAARDRSAWMEVSRRMGRGLRAEIDTAPTGQILQQRMADQVGLITSLPTDAAERVHKLTLEGIVQGTRAEHIAKEIMRSGDVAKSRANMIARTEVSRTSTELTKARAEHVGSTHFRWRTADDSDVRHDHRVLNGKIFRWDDPPIADQRSGVRALPGGIYNCRCWADPLLDED